MFTLWTQIWKHHGLWVNSVDDLLLQMDHEAKTASYKLTFYVNTFEQIYAYIQFNQIMTTFFLIYLAYQKAEKLVLIVDEKLFYSHRTVNYN